MASWTIRPAGSDDVEGVLAFWLVSAEGVSITDDTTGVVRLLARDPSALLIAESRGEIIGSVIAGWDGWRCHLYRLAVSPSHRRQGIGAALMTAAEGRLEVLGGRRADAMVLNSNEDAHSMYRALGYVPQGQWQRWVKRLRS